VCRKCCPGRIAAAWLVFSGAPFFFSLFSAVSAITLLLRFVGSVGNLAWFGGIGVGLW